MKTRTLVLRMLFAVLAPATGYCIYPTVEEAQALFSSEQMNATNVSMDGAYEDFRSRLCESTSMEMRQAVESVVIDAITSIVVRVSTNVVDNSVGVGIIKSRGLYFKALRCSLQDFKTNAEECVRLARYIGNIRGADFPSDLARSRGFGARMFLTTNETELAQWRQQEEPMREARLRELAGKRDLQMRVLLANEAVYSYKASLFCLCGESVVGCRQSMSDEDFSSFTNEVVAVSHASFDEQRVLLGQLRNDGR